MSHIVSRMKREGYAQTIPAGVVEPCSLDSSALFGLLSGVSGGAKCSARKESVAVHSYEASWAVDFAHGASASSALGLLVAIIAFRSRK
jgi:hypothetical protein